MGRNLTTSPSWQHTEIKLYDVLFTPFLNKFYRVHPSSHGNWSSKSNKSVIHISKVALPIKVCSLSLAKDGKTGIFYATKYLISHRYSFWISSGTSKKRFSFISLGTSGIYWVQKSARTWVLRSSTSWRSFFAWWWGPIDRITMLVSEKSKGNRSSFTLVTWNVFG